MESFSEIVLRHRDQPSFSHRLYEGNSDEVIEDVVSGRVDVGVFHFDSRKRREMEALLESKGLEYHFLANIEPHIIISRKHPLLLQQKPVNLHTLAEYGFLWYLGHAMIIFTSFSPKEIRMQKKCARKSPIFPAAPP